MFALNGTLMALDVLGLPFLGVPMMAQFRHDTKLVSLEWFGKLDYTALKWSTAGDFMVNEGGKKVVVNGKSANAPLRTAAGVYCNVRPYGTHHQHPLHARPAVFAGQEEVQRRSQDRQHPFRDEHARACAWPTPRACFSRWCTRPDRSAASPPSPPRRRKTRSTPASSAGCCRARIQAQAPVHGGRLRGAQGERRRDRRAAAEGLQGRHGELGRRDLRAHLRHQLRPAAARHDPAAHPASSTRPTSTATASPTSWPTRPTCCATGARSCSTTCKRRRRHEQAVEGHGLHHDQRQGHDERHVPRARRADLRADAGLRRRDAAAPAEGRRDRGRRPSSPTTRASTSC